MKDDKLPLYPRWRQAEAELLANGLTYGSLITDDQLDEMLGIGPPKSIADVTRVQLMRFGFIEALRASLLVNHSMCLQRTRNLGYTVIPPEQQTNVVMKNRTHEMKRAMSKLKSELSHVRQDLLTDAQRKENTDAIAKIGTLSGMVRKQLKGPKEKA